MPDLQSEKRPKNRIGVCGLERACRVSVEINVVGVKCGLSCAYCYQGKLRRATKNQAPALDHDAIQAAVLAAKPGPAGFSVFGGEALLAPVEDLERIWAFGLKHYGTNGIQTSGAPITEEHLALFKRYKVHVGFSIDGPGELNDARVAGSRAATRKATDHSIAMMERCLAEGIACSLIVTLHRLNASLDRLPRLLDWFRGLDAAGLSSARLHLLERDGPGGERLALTDVENTSALIAAQKLEDTLPWLRFDVFADIAKKLRDPEAAATCVWNGCDPWTTPAVHGIEADGSRSLCQRVHKDGQKWSPAETRSNIRQQVLWSTSQELGGCRGCRFFLQCGGHCPGTAIDGDWRKRTVDCRTWFALLERTEQEMVSRGEAPASLAPDLAARIERSLAISTGNSHGDAHGDSPHGDQHGDHTDGSAK